MPSSPLAGASIKARRLAVVGLLLGSLVGCTLFSKPLCDEENGVIDSRLLGTWDIPVTEADGEDCTWILATIAKTEGNNSLTIRQSDDCSGNREEAIIEARTIELGGRWFLTARDPAAKVSADWLTFQYRFVSPDEIHVFPLIESRLVEAVRSGRLPGRVGTPDVGLLLKWLGVKPDETVLELKATPEQMRDYLREHPDTGFDFDEPLYILRRSTGEPKPNGARPPTKARAIETPAVEPPAAPGTPDPADPPKRPPRRLRKPLRDRPLRDRSRPRVDESSRLQLEENGAGAPATPPRP